MKHIFSAIAVAILVIVAWVVFVTPPCGGDYDLSLGGDKYLLFSCKSQPKPIPEPLARTTIKEIRICYIQEEFDWGEKYVKRASKSVGEIRCGSKDVDDPNTCGFGATIQIPIKDAQPKGSPPIPGQERYLRTVENSCSPGECCRYDMDNRESVDAINDRYSYYWRHRSCGTTRTIGIEVQKWQPSGRQGEQCFTPARNELGTLFEFSVPVDARHIKIFPVEPLSIPPQLVSGSEKSIFPDYDLDCEEIGNTSYCSMTSN